MRIDCDFPGGNILIDQVQPDEVQLHQDLRDTIWDWFYWYFRVRGAAGRTVRFVFTRSLALGTRGPAISHDEGRTWNWLPKAVDGENTFTYCFGANEDEVRFSFAMPYVLSDWERFAQARPWLSRETLARTRGGRAVPIARVGHGPRAIVLAARHHCCEMMPNYALEGLIDFVHHDPQGAELARQATLHIVPLMDLDGVEAGDQGKARRPRDHGRDYLGESLYPEISAMREQLHALAPQAVLDLHCPWIRNDHNEHIYLVGSADEKNAAEQQRFSAVLEEVARGPLPFSAAGFLPFGVAWNTPANNPDGLSMARFAERLPGCILSTGIELPYANAGQAEVNAASARAFGEDLARALSAWLAS